MTVLKTPQNEVLSIKPCMGKTNNTSSGSALQARSTCPLLSPTGTPFSSLLKRWLPLLFLYDAWKAGRGLKWRLNAFNPTRQKVLGTGSEEDIFPTSPSPQEAQRQPRRVRIWEALRLPSELERFWWTQVYTQRARSEAVPWWFNISFTSQPHWGEHWGLHLAQSLHPPEATRDRWHWPSCTGCFWLYWPWGHRFPQSCPILLSRYYLSSRIVAELQHVFYSPYVLLFGQ